MRRSVLPAIFQLRFSGKNEMSFQRIGYCALLFFTATRLSPALAQQKFVEACRGSYCFEAFIENVSPQKPGVFKVKVRYAGRDAQAKAQVDRLTEIVSCNKDDAYVSIRRETIAIDPDAATVAGAAKHIAPEAQELWKAICSRR
jgi:hypothetical protein